MVADDRVRRQTCLFYHALVAVSRRANHRHVSQVGTVTIRTGIALNYSRFGLHAYSMIRDRG